MRSSPRGSAGHSGKKLGFKREIPNLKFQYSITKTFTIIASHRRAKPSLPVMMPMRTTNDESSVSNF